jgi:hypothetical protein
MSLGRPAARASTSDDNLALDGLIVRVVFAAKLVEIPLGRLDSEV